MTRRIPDRPCVMFECSHTGTPGPCNHCAIPTDIRFDSWMDVEYRFELENRGINSEYAAQLAMSSSIKHQAKPDCKPYDSAYLCEIHLIEAMKIALRMTDAQPIRGLLTQFTTDKKLIVFDRNDKDEMTTPKATVGPYADIHEFLRVYEEMGEP